jgi:hypothetical protein
MQHCTELMKKFFSLAYNAKFAKRPQRFFELKTFMSLCFCGIFIFLNCNLTAQVTADIYIKTFATHDSVMLRWVPANPEIWKLGNKYGYEIERYTTDEYLDLEGKDPTGKGTVLNSAPILPLAKTDTAWNKLIRADKLNSFVHQSIYEESTIADPAKKKVEEQTKFGLTLKACDLSLATAKAHGLYFVDKTISSGQIYIYRIRIANLPATIKSNPGIATADEKLSVLKAPDKIHGDFRNRKAAISFNIISTKEEYAGYIVERSEDSIHFQRINPTLLTFARSQYEQNKTEEVYQDTFPQNHKTYWYRVRGYSYFGITGPPSVSVKGKGKDEWNYYPEIDTLFSNDNKTVEMKWHLPPMKDSMYLKGFFVLHGEKDNGKYTMLNSSILNKRISTFRDQHATFENYYVIGALSTEGDTALSYPYLFQLKDNDPPTVPENLSGTIDTNGIVHLQWKKVTAPDLKGYRVFRCNSLREEFYEVSDSVLCGNFFIDTITIKTLTHDVYYCVRSVDRMYNNSKNSLPCKLKRPDKIPPVPVVIKNCFHTDSTIVLSWINSSSDDVQCVELKRKSSSGEMIQMGTWSGKDTVSHFTDFSATVGMNYSYSIFLTDSSGNKSVTDFPDVHFQPRIYPALKNLSALADREKRMVTVSWEKPAQEVDRYIIYKCKKGEQLREWKTFDGKNSVVVDKELYPGNDYTYKVKAVMKNGSETKLVSVEVVY